ncbi:hypothetical protein ACF1AE_28580 [Streptomyces sp. NPDC014986]|uniref:hypothetical protein n=1 Tax=Streptomyces sp. NPDC014986 TaxID=3364934 RepID=UPI0036FADA67
MRDGHRADAERLSARAVEEEVRRSGGRSDGKVLLARGVSLKAGRQAWRLGMVPGRHAREVMGVAVGGKA